MTDRLAGRAGQAELDAARLLLARMGISPADLPDGAPGRPPAPTFAEYAPVEADAVSAGTRRVCRSYWNRIVDHWGTRRLDEPTPSEIKQFVEHVKAHVVVRRNARGERGAAEHLIAALRCLHKHGVADGYVGEADNPARKVAKPRRLLSTRRAVPAARPERVNLCGAAGFGLLSESGSLVGFWGAASDPGPYSEIGVGLSSVGHPGAYPEPQVVARGGPRFAQSLRDPLPPSEKQGSVGGCPTEEITTAWRCPRPVAG